MLASVISSSVGFPFVLAILGIGCAIIMDRKLGD